MIRGHRRPKDREGGFIMVPVLWILLTLAGLAGVLCVYLVNTAAALSLNDDHVRSDALVSASLELAAYELSSNTTALRRPAGSFFFRLDHARVSVAFRSETARIDLNHASREMFANFFQALGARARDASDYADRIVAWRTPSTDGPPDDEDSFNPAGVNHLPRGGPFATVDELQLVADLPPALVDKAMPFVTVFSGRPEIDVLDAAPEVVAALPEMTPALLKSFLEQRASLPRDIKSITAALGPAKAGASIEGGDAVRVRTAIAFDNGRQAGAEAVILLDGGDDPYRVLSWRDDPDAQAAHGQYRRSP